MNKATRPVEAPKVLNMREIYKQAIRELSVPPESIPLDGWPLWNKFCGGFRMREFTILCGPTGSGKTQFLAAMSAQLVRQRVKHFVMSVETGPTDFMKRVMSYFAGQDLNTGEVVKVDRLVSEHLKNGEYFEADTIEFSLYEDRLSVEQLIYDLDTMIALKGCKIAMIDNLNFFMEVTRASDQIVEMDRVVHELVIFAKKRDVHLILVMHPRKTDGGRVESEFDIKGSSTAVQEAHNVFLLNRLHPSTLEANPNLFCNLDRELKFAKLRKRGIHTGKRIAFRGVTCREIGEITG